MFHFKWLPNSTDTRRRMMTATASTCTHYTLPTLLLLCHTFFFPFLFSCFPVFLSPLHSVIRSRCRYHLLGALWLLLRIAGGSTVRHSIYIPYICRVLFYFFNRWIESVVHGCTRVLHTNQTENKYKKNDDDGDDADEFLLHFSNGFFRSRSIHCRHLKFCSTFTIACVIAHRLECKESNGAQWRAMAHGRGERDRNKSRWSSVCISRC